MIRQIEHTMKDTYIEYQINQNFYLLNSSVKELLIELMYGVQGLGHNLCKGR